MMNLRNLSPLGQHIRVLHFDKFHLNINGNFLRPQQGQTLFVFIYFVSPWISWVSFSIIKLTLLAIACSLASYQLGGILYKSTSLNSLKYSVIEIILKNLLNNIIDLLINKIFKFSKSCIIELHLTFYPYHSEAQLKNIF